MTASEIRDEAMRALVAALDRVEPTAPSWCTGWSAHEIAAHVAGAAQERASLIEDHLKGLPARRTRSFEEREAPLRSLPAAELRGRLVREAARFERAVSRLEPHEAFEYTGWTMTPGLFRAHSRSEAALHRWDLVGDDHQSARLLSDPGLTSHAIKVFAAIPALPEARRWTRAAFTAGPVRLSSPDGDVLVTPGEGLSLAAARCHSPVPVAELTAADRLLVLWGRCPARLRQTSGRPETIDDILARLFRQTSPGPGC